MCNQPEDDVRSYVETYSLNGVTDYIARSCKLFFLGFPSLSKHVEASLILKSTYSKPFYTTYKINYAGHIYSTPSRVYVIIRYCVSVARRGEV